MKTKLVLAAMLALGMCAAQEAKAQSKESNNNQESEVSMVNKIKKGNKLIENGVVAGYKLIEKGVTSGYKAVENGVVSGYSKVEDKFVEAFLTKEGETPADAKMRLKKQ